MDSTFSNFYALVGADGSWNYNYLITLAITDTGSYSKAFTYMNLAS